jgi:flagellar biosynthesis anti-sigma factor FlgM
MKVNDPNLSHLSSAETAQSARSQATGKTSESAGEFRQAGIGESGSNDDVHLSELVRSLRALAADSPERHAYVDQIAQAYSNGNHQVDAGATAGKMIDEALR